MRRNEGTCPCGECKNSPTKGRWMRDCLAPAARSTANWSNCRKRVALLASKVVAKPRNSAWEPGAGITRRKAFGT